MAKVVAVEDYKPAKVVGVEDAKKTQGLFGTRVGEKSDTLRKARLPSQAVAAGSEAMMDAIEPETQSVPLNAAIRFPQTVASIGTKLFSDAITPESMVVQGAAKAAPLLAKPVNAVGRWIGSGAERLSGLSYKTPGVLAETVENPSLPFKPGVKTANAGYAAKTDATQVGDEFKNVLDHKTIVETAIEKLKTGALTADEALIARQSLDQMPQVPNSNFYPLRQSFDDIAKTKFAGEDAVRAMASKAENVRNLWPLNNTGTPSIGKIMLAGAGGYASMTSPYAAVTIPAMSPAVQAGLAALLGVGKKVVGMAAKPALANPTVTGIGLSELLNRKKQ